jgi:hypothetical protein
MNNRQTLFSPCRKYRYTLWREWAGNLLIKPDTDHPDQYLMVIGLNPSTADETKDDPTIRKCIKFAKSWGFGALAMTNLFAWRDTDPAGMKSQPWPVGIDNDLWLAEIASRAGLILAAWGNHGTHEERASDVVTRVLKRNKLHCLAINQSTGQPKHPLYCKDSSRPIPFP